MDDNMRRGCGHIQHNGEYLYTTDQHGFRVYSPPVQVTGVEKQYRAAMKTRPGIIMQTIIDKKTINHSQIIQVAPATIKPAASPIINPAEMKRNPILQIGLPKKTIKEHSHAVHYIPSRNTVQLGHIHTPEQTTKKLKLHETYLANAETQNLLQKKGGDTDTAVMIQITRSDKNIVPGSIYKPELSPSHSLLYDWKQGLITWDQYTARFKREIRNNPQAQKTLDEIYSLSQTTPVTLLCYENTSRPGTHCHRHIIMDTLKEMVEKENTPLLYEKNPHAYISQLEKDMGDATFFQTINQIAGKDAAHWVMGKTWNNTSNITAGSAEKGGNISRNTEQSMLRGLRTKIWEKTNQNYGVQGLSHDDFVEAMLRGYIKPQNTGHGWVNTLQKKDYPLPDYYKQAGELKNIIQLHTTPDGKIKYYDIPLHQRLLAARLSLIEHTKKDGWVNNSIKTEHHITHRHRVFSEEESLRIDQKTRNILNQSTQIFRIKQNTKIVLRTPRDILYKMRQIENCREAIQNAKKTNTREESRIRYIHEMQEKIKTMRLTPMEAKQYDEYIENKNVLTKFYDELKYEGKGTEQRRKNIQEQGWHWIVLYQKGFDKKTGTITWKNAKEYKRLPGEQINVEGRRMQYLLRNKDSKTSMISWGRLWHMQQKYPNMPFLKKHPEIQQDLNKYQKTPKTSKTEKNILFNNSRPNRAWHCPDCGEIVYDRVEKGGNIVAHGTYFMKKPDRNISMCCGTDLGTQPLTEHEIYMHKQEHHEGPGTEPTISAPSKHREDIIASPPPMPETHAASKEYKDLYEDVFSQIRR